MKPKAYVINSTTGTMTGLIQMIPIHVNDGTLAVVTYWSIHSGLTIEGILSCDDALHRFNSLIAMHEGAFWGGKP